MKVIKKVSLAILATVALTQIAQASTGAFTGFYLGAHTGATIRKDSAQLSHNGVNLLPVGAKNKKATGINYGLYGGYIQTVGALAWGLEANLSDDTANREATGYLNGGKFVHSYDRGVVLGVAPRLGAVIDGNHLVYAKLGLEVSRDKLSGKYTSDRSFLLAEKTQTKVAVVPSVGYEYAFGKVLARIEYGYNLGSKIRVNHTYSQKYTAHVIKVGLAYKF